jgi:hypothetical protein
MNISTTAERPQLEASSSSIRNESGPDDSGEAFIAWVLGYGYAAGRLPERPSREQEDPSAVGTRPETGA